MGARIQRLPSDPANPRADVMRIAQETGATPYDVPKVELGHHGELCSFDAFIAKYDLRDAALAKLALLVRAADGGQPVGQVLKPLKR